MIQKSKEYFFYSNTDKYKTITNGLNWSIILVIHCCIFHFCIEYDFDFILNIILAIAVGYIIYYFYFSIITYAEIKRNEDLSIYIIGDVIAVFFKYASYTDIYSSDELNKKYTTLYTHLLFIQEKFSNTYNIDIKFKSIINIIKASIEDSNQNNDLYIRTNQYIIKLLSQMIFSFEDWQDILEEIKKDKTREPVVEIIRHYILLLESGMLLPS